jgi:hypothetical protein
VDPVMRASSVWIRMVSFLGDYLEFDF